jgi:hypothetical protein
MCNSGDRAWLEQQYRRFIAWWTNSSSRFSLLVHWTHVGSTDFVAKMEQLRIKVCKPEIVLGFLTPWNAFDKQAVSRQDTGTPNSLFLHKHNSQQWLTENIKLNQQKNGQEKPKETVREISCDTGTVQRVVQLDDVNDISGSLKAVTALDVRWKGPGFAFKRCYLFTPFKQQKH